MEPEKKSNGALIGSIIIIIILLVGGIYIWQSKVKNLPIKNTENTVQTNETTTADLNDLNTLDQDLNTTDTNTGVDVSSIQ